MGILQYFFLLSIYTGVQLFRFSEYRQTAFKVVLEIDKLILKLKGPQNIQDNVAQSWRSNTTTYYKTTVIKVMCLGTNSAMD